MPNKLIMDVCQNLRGDIDVTRFATARQIEKLFKRVRSLAARAGLPSEAEVEAIENTLHAPRSAEMLGITMAWGRFWKKHPDLARRAGIDPDDIAGLIQLDVASCGAGACAAEVLSQVRLGVAATDAALTRDCQHIADCAAVLEDRRGDAGAAAGGEDEMGALQAEATRLERASLKQRRKPPRPRKKPEEAGRRKIRRPGKSTLMPGARRLSRGHHG